MIDMIQNQKHNVQRLFNDEEKKEQKKKEEEEKNDGNGIGKVTSKQVKDAHAAGMGALERSNENQIEEKGRMDSEDEPVY